MFVSGSLQAVPAFKYKQFYYTGLVNFSSIDVENMNIKHGTMGNPKPYYRGTKKLYGRGKCRVFCLCGCRERMGGITLLP